MFQRRKEDKNVHFSLIGRITQEMLIVPYIIYIYNIQVCFKLKLKHTMCVAYKCLFLIVVQHPFEITITRDADRAVAVF